MRIRILTFILLFGYQVMAQKSIISGKVIDQITLQPIPGTTVQVAEKGIVTLADQAGNFAIDQLSDGSFDLTITSLGYETIQQSVKIENQMSIYLPVKLKTGNINLEELIVAADKPNNQQIINSIDIKLRPVNNSQEILRMVPGLFIGQHAGGGKAEQIFLRGFDIDHGTDIRLTVDGMPVNMVSHAHGQGYADLHFVIPELIERVHFNKGTYSADKGDFSTAGWVDFKTKDVLDKNTAKVELGQYDSYRIFSAVDLLSQIAKEKGTSAYIASEYNFSNSYFDAPQHFKRFNAIGKFNSKLGTNSLFNASVSTFTSTWNHSGQIPDRSVEAGDISFYGAIDDTEGGKTSRTNANLKLTTPQSNGLMTHQIFYSNYNFELFSNFTFFLNDPIHGDQIKQKENRNILGYNGSYTKESKLGKWPLRSTAGINYRQDFIRNNELSHTKNHTELLEAHMLGHVNVANAGFYIDEELRLSNQWTANVGLRYEIFRNQYTDKLLTNLSNKASQQILLPKFNLFFTPSSNLQLYFKSGKSFHSNDTRVVVQQKGQQILPPAYGTDLGINWKPFSKLFVNAAAWYLWLDQEFVYVGDEGVVEPSGKSKRQGIDLTMRYQITKQLFADFDINFTQPRALDAEKGENHIPLAPTYTSIGGFTYYAKNGLNGSIRYRHMGNRPANEDNSLVAKGYFLTDMQVNYTKPRYNIGFSVNNIFNTKWKETQFATETRLKNEAEPVDEIHFTAGSPFFAKLSLTFFW
jgi:outer membrane receptor protein involved in Fe transport